MVTEPPEAELGRKPARMRRALEPRRRSMLAGWICASERGSASLAVRSSLPRRSRSSRSTRIRPRVAVGGVRARGLALTTPLYPVHSDLEGESANPVAGKALLGQVTA